MAAESVSMYVTTAGPIPLVEPGESFTADDGASIAAAVVEGIRSVEPQTVHPNFLP